MDETPKHFACADEFLASYERAPRIICDGRPDVEQEDFPAGDSWTTRTTRELAEGTTVLCPECMRLKWLWLQGDRAPVDFEGARALRERATP